MSGLLTIGWALHRYPVIWVRIAGARADGRLVARHPGRGRAFLEAHQHFFGADGAPVHQGRSLTHRFATAGPLWAGALADATPRPPGRTRRFASGTLGHFAERGAPDERGLLTLGWYRPFLPGRLGRGRRHGAARRGARSGLGAGPPRTA